MTGSIRSPSCRLPTLPPSAFARAGGFLFAAAMVAGASGAPWLDRVGIDPAWLMADVSDSLVRGVPRSGVSVVSRSDMVLREPLRLDWGGSEILQTLSGEIRTDPGSLRPWIQVVRSASARRFATSTTSVGNPPRDQGLRGGTRFDAAWLEAWFESGIGADRQSLSGSLRIFREGAGLETGASRSASKSRLELHLPEGDLELKWHDRTDSIGAGLEIPIGVSRWNAGAWRTNSASLGSEGLVDTGSATGWNLGVEASSGWGGWKARVVRDRFGLRTLGVLGGRVFHDKNWHALREAIGLGWENGSWDVEAGTRRLRAELVPGGIDQAFVDWNMVPLDAFTRVGAVLGSRSEYVAGHLEVERWSALVSKSWTRDGSNLSIGGGGSWTGFDGRIDRTTLVVRGLFPYLTDDVPFQGSGWVAMAEARVRGKWSMGSLGWLAAFGAWHLPCAGEASSGPREPSPSASPGKNRTSPVDPLGFYQASLEWVLAW